MSRMLEIYMVVCRFARVHVDMIVHLAFLSSNEVYWKTRWEDSEAGPATPFRTMVRRFSFFTDD